MSPFLQNSDPSHDSTEPQLALDRDPIPGGLLDPDDLRSLGAYAPHAQRYASMAERLGGRIAEATSSLLKKIPGPVHATAAVSGYGTPQFKFEIAVHASGGPATLAAQILEKTLPIPWVDLDLPWLERPAEKGPVKGISSAFVSVAWALTQALRAAWVSRMHAFFTTTHENIGGEVSLDLRNGRISLFVRAVPVENNLLQAPRVSGVSCLLEQPGRFNPGLVVEDGRLRAFVRDANYWVDPCSGIGFLRDRNTFVSRSDRLEIDLRGGSQKPRLGAVDDQVACSLAPEDSCLEDVRLFHVDEQLYALGVLRARKIAAKPLIQMCLAKVEWRESSAVLYDAHVLPSPTGSRVEKNWMPLHKDGRLYFVYSVHPLVLYELDFKTWALKEPRQLAQGERGWWGGSPFVRHGDGFLAVVHQKCARNNGLVYRNAFVQISADLQHVVASKPFAIRGAAVEFASGLAVFEDQVLLGMGYDDKTAGIEQIPAEQVRRMLLAGDRW